MEVFGKYSFEKVYTMLCMGACRVIFIKKNGDSRVMLCTRHVAIANMSNRFASRALQAHDAKCNRSNGNIAVIDLEIGEPRSFSVSRVVSIEPVDMFNNALWKAEFSKNEELRRKIASIEINAVEDSNIENKVASEIKEEDVNDFFKSSPIA